MSVWHENCYTLGWSVKENEPVLLTQLLPRGDRLLNQLVRGEMCAFVVWVAFAFIGWSSASSSSDLIGAYRAKPRKFYHKYSLCSLKWLNFSSADGVNSHSCQGLTCSKEVRGGREGGRGGEEDDGEENWSPCVTMLKFKIKNRGTLPLHHLDL